MNRSIPHISLHHVTRFEPITAAHFDRIRRYKICYDSGYRGLTVLRPVITDNDDDDDDDDD